MELSREPRAKLMAYALIGSVVEVDKQRRPFFGQGLVIYGEAVVLAGDVTALANN